MIVNGDSGRSEHSSGVVRNSGGFPVRRDPLDGSHTATDETTPRTAPLEIRDGPEPPGYCGMGLGTVSAYLTRAKAAGVTWPLPADLDDAALATFLEEVKLAA